MELNKYNDETKYTVIFILSISHLLIGHKIDIDDTLLFNIREFRRVRLLENHKKYFPIFDKLSPVIKYDYAEYAEIRDSLSSLFSLYDEIDSFSKHIELLGSIDQNFLDTISKLAGDFYKFVKSFDNYYVRTRFPQ